MPNYSLQVWSDSYQIISFFPYTAPTSSSKKSRWVMCVKLPRPHLTTLYIHTVSCLVPHTRKISRAAGSLDSTLRWARCRQANVETSYWFIQNLPGNRSSTQMLRRCVSRHGLEEVVALQFAGNIIFPEWIVTIKSPFSLLKLGTGGLFLPCHKTQQCRRPLMTSGWKSGEEEETGG